MTAALIILGALILVGAILYLFHHRDLNRGEDTPPATAAVTDAQASKNNDSSDDDESPCCGMHITCEKDSLLPEASEKIEYFDDEELDAYIGRDADSYTDEEIEQFRDVLLTLLPTDIAPWGRSIQLRGITLPQPVREELLMIVAEARKARENH